MESTELTVEGEFATEADMIEWGFSERFDSNFITWELTKLSKEHGLYQNLFRCFD